MVQMTPVQLKMARAALGWGVRELAKKAGVTANTVTRIENGSDAKQSTIAALRAALESAGVEFIAENGGGAGVRLKKRSETVADLTRQIDIRQTHMTPESDHEKPSPNRAMKQLRRARDQNELAVLKNRRAKSRKEEKK
jgi:transcriptional regulator with XRE-family HTH domain